MGNDNSKDELNRTREDAARREAEARATIAREKEQADRIAKEKQDLQNRMHDQERNFSQRLLDVSREKDRQLELLQEEHLRLERLKDEDLRDANEKSMQMNKEFIERMESMEKGHRENMFKHQRIADETIEKKDKDLKEAAEKILQVKKEDEERAEKLLAEKRRIFELEKEALHKTVENKDRDLKETFDKVVITHKEGMVRAEEIRKQMKHEKEEEVSKVEMKLTEKSKELKDANEKILEVKREGDERVDKVIKEKQKEQNEVVERVEKRNKEFMESMKDSYQKVVDAEKEHSRRMDAMLQNQIEYSRREHEQMLKIKDQVQEETKKRLELQSEAHTRVSDMYERMIQENKQQAIQNSFQQSLQMMSIMAGMQQGQLQGTGMNQIQTAMLAYQKTLIQQMSQPAVTRVGDHSTLKEEKQDKQAKPEVVHTPMNQIGGGNRDAPEVDTNASVVFPPDPPVAPQNTDQASDSSASSSDRLPEDKAATSGSKIQENADLMMPDEYCQFISSAFTEISFPILERTNKIRDVQVDAVKQLQADFNSLGSIGINNDILPQGEKFWELIVEILENHKIECQKQLVKPLLTIEGELKKSLTQLVESTKEANLDTKASSANGFTANGIVKATLQKSQNACLEEIALFGQTLNDNLETIVNSYILAINSLNEDFRTVLIPGIVDGESSMSAEELCKRITRNGKIYLEDCNAEVKRCQKKVARVIEENGEKLITDIKSKLV